MKAEITIIGNNICCRIIELDREFKIELSHDAHEKLRAWQNAYACAVRTGQNGNLPAIGQEMFDWLNRNRWATEWFNGHGARELMIRVDTIVSEEARLLLDAPWEILSNENNFLAADTTHDYIVYRNIAPSRDIPPLSPAYSDLAVVFMAAAPEGQKELDFEAEEAAILKATQNLPLSLFVEESGCHKYLKDKLSLEGPFEAVHLSCHGDILPSKGPVLVLEDPEGNPDITLPADIINALGENKAPLVFLSACRTAESNREKNKGKSGDQYPAASDSFAQLLISAGVANVLGWSGSVYDLDAASFASVFYDELARYASIPYAVAKARQHSLLAQLDDLKKGRHWHLARLYIGNQGGASLCRQDKPKRQLTSATKKEFLDRAEQRVPVATPFEFVGRRRQAQKIMKLFREGAHAGILIHGMGNIGKSSLAARLAGRMPRLKPVVIYKDYDAPSIFDRLLNAVPPASRKEVRQNWKETIDENPESLQEALEDLLLSAFQDAPIFLIIDDLEQILEKPTRNNTRIFIKDAPGNPNDWRIAITAVIKAFEACEPVHCKLLFTSRYRFTLPDVQGNDVADRLAAVQLPPMSTMERTKQWKAAKSVSGAASKALVESETRLLAQIIEAAGGNPGLQHILSHPLLSGETQAAQTALEQVLYWKETGEIPRDASKAQDFFIRISFETYQNALTHTQQALLRTAAFFSENVPVPQTALLAAGTAVGIDNVPFASDRLTALGLVDQWGNINNIPHLAANPLARPLVSAPFTANEKKILADTVFDPLCRAWQKSDETFSIDPRTVELSRIALMTDVPLERLEKAVEAAANFLFHENNDAAKALSFLKPAIVKMDHVDHQPQPGFILIGANCAERIGDRDFQLDLLKRGESLTSPDIIACAQIMALYAEATMADQGPEKTIQALNTSAELFKKEEEKKSYAVTMGKIADILEQRGETDEALRILKEEQLPVYERLGDVRSRAVTMGKIADILEQRGETDEALRIRKEEQLPVYERLGDVRSRAVTMGKIADILEQRGETDEALRILKEEQLPVFERLGDVRSRAVTMGQIADILEQRGETDEALRIRKEEELPVYERLGDVRSRAVTMGQIADILVQRGETDEALRIRKEEQLSVYERLGDVRSRAVTMGQIADILEQRGETDEALRIRKEEELPVFERLGDVRSRTVTMGKIADILEQRGETDEALRIRKEEELPVYERLGDVRSRAVTMGQIADILVQRGETDEALRIRKEEELPVFERLGDVRERAVTMGQIADILVQRGETDEALRIHMDERLPVATKIKDKENIAHIRFACAKIRLDTGGLEKGDAQIIVDELMESFSICKQIQRTDGIAMVGNLLGQIMAKRGHPNDALTILDQSGTAFQKLGMNERYEQLRSLQKQIKEKFNL